MIPKGIVLFCFPEQETDGAGFNVILISL